MTTKNKHQELILLNPGPVNLTQRVRNALLSPDICHREPEFTELQETIRRALLDVYGLSSVDYASVLITGSGTAAVESMITSLISHDGKLLVLSNGVYGERIKKIAECYGIDTAVLSCEWGREFDTLEIEKILREDKALSSVAVVHHETTTGRLNDVSKVGAVCKRFGKALFVDAVSSFGAEELQFDNWGITACAVSANKCLHSVPGASFVIVQRKSMRSTPCRSVYLNLFDYYQHQENGSSPFTHAVHVFYALAEALAEFEEMGGWRERKKTYEKLASLIRKNAATSGIRQYLTSGPLACSLTAFYLPDNISYTRLHDLLRQAGFVIYAGQGKISSMIFRIANMGALTENDIDRLFVHIKEILCRL
ncbi:MAG TPA: 2-aminoethylphosphonate aminotransferase [Thermodesulfovibrionia bacterium]|nr:2-aminoethylphosphonate aminotransferase [Thermodesulfovibrionia bacterium]